MRIPFSALITVRHPDEDVQRRGQNIILLAAGLNLIAVLAAVSVVIAGARAISEQRVILPFIASLAAQTVIIILARNGRVDLAGSVMVAMAIAGITGAALLNTDQLLIPIFFLVPLLIAIAVLRPIGVVAALFGVLAGMGVIAGALPPPENVLLRNVMFAIIGLLSLFTTLAGVLISAGHRRLQRQLRHALQHADQTAQALHAMNEELDLRVQLQTETLRQIVQELEERSVQQERLLQEIAGQRDLIRELSLPILPVGRDVLVAPLIGALDGERMRLLQNHAFQRVERTRARMLILDITGVPLIDTHVAQGLSRLIQGLRLLGADVAIVGVRPEVAQTIVGLGIQLRDVSVFSDLGSALQYAAMRFVERQTLA